MVDEGINEPYVKIGIRDVYVEQRLQAERLTKMENTLANLAEVVKMQVKLASDIEVLKAEGAGSEHDRRIRNLERWKAALPANLFLTAVSVTVVVVTAIHHS